jgi:C4-dicarboxylate transporter DctQ subunit
VSRALEILRRLERAVVAALMILMSLAFALNVGVRELLPSQAARFSWIEEACLYALSWLVFLGLGLALERGRQIAMTSLLERISARPRRALRFIIDLTGLAFSLYVAKLSFDIALLVARSGQTSPTLDMSTAWLYAAMPVGFALLALRYALELFDPLGRLAARDASAGH